MKKHTAVFANFVLHFGTRHVLADGFEQIVLPAFTDEKLVRTYGDSRYHFFNVKLLNSAGPGEEPIGALAGHFIQTTELRREQVYDDILGIVSDEASMESSPSAFFVLIINNHRLIYFPETANSPDFNKFKATCYSFVRSKYEVWVDAAYRSRLNGKDKITKKSIRELFGPPALEILPLSGDGDIRQFIGQYKVLKKIEFRLIRPNDDLQAGEIFEDLRELLEGMNSTNAKIIASNPDGLDKEKSIEAISEAAAGENQEILLHGLNDEGNKLDGNNENMQLKVEISNPPTEDENLAKKLFSVFSHLQNTCAILSGPPSEKAIQVIKKMLDGV